VKTKKTVINNQWW